MAEEPNNLSAETVNQEENNQTTPKEPKVENKEATEEKKNPLEERVSNLANKAKEAETNLEKVNQEKAQLERERDFYSSFSDSLGNYPQAKDYKDAIKEKVMSGYTVEDATVAVLAKEGKLDGAQPIQAPSNPLGGSSANSPVSGTKPVSEMTQEERLSALMEAEARGDISLT